MQLLAPDVQLLFNQNLQYSKYFDTGGISSAFSLKFPVFWHPNQNAANFCPFCALHKTGDL